MTRELPLCRTIMGNPWAFGNIVLLPLLIIGLFIGAFVDSQTGAGFKLEEELHADLKSGSGADDKPILLCRPS